MHRVSVTTQLHVCALGGKGNAVTQVTGGVPTKGTDEVKVARWVSPSEEAGGVKEVVAVGSGVGSGD